MQSCHMCIQCKINRLIICKSSATVAIIIKRNYISAFNDFCRIVYKSFDTVIYFSSRYEGGYDLE